VRDQDAVEAEADDGSIFRPSPHVECAISLERLTVMLNRPRNRAWHSVLSFMIPLIVLLLRNVQSVRMLRQHIGSNRC